MIPGLTIIPNFVNQQTHDALQATIDQQPWDQQGRQNLKRRVQHYGYIYDCKARKITPDLYLGDLPNWLKINGLEEWFPQPPNQMIINEYLPGQGISAHIDCMPCFDDTIASISLGSSCCIDFIKAGEKHSVALYPRTLLVMQGEARYKWQHRIAARKSDVIEGEKVLRGQRVSLTFRRVVV